jgi:hypothetical protein
VNGELEVLGAVEIDLKTQRTQVRIDGVKKTLTLEAEHGEVRIQRVAGAMKLDLDRVECEADAVKGETTVRMEHGSLTQRGISAAAEITGDGSELELMMASAVPLSATTRNAQLMVELPKGGITLDAVTRYGRLSLPDRALEVKEDEDEERRSDAKIRGGGLTLRLRNEHGDIVVRDGGMMEHDTDAAEHPRPPSPPHAPPPPPPEPLEPPKPPVPRHDPR